MKKRVTATLLSLFLLAGTACVSGCADTVKGSLTIHDGKGEPIAAVETLTDGREELAGVAYRAYIETVLSESEAALADARNCSVKKARRMLLRSDCVISTALDTAIYAAVEKAYENLRTENLTFGCAVTDLQGHTLALFSAGDDTANFATAKTPPYSSFKPLCVYMPAIENAQVNWSTVYPDMPIKKIEGEDGRQYDWPVNATGTYAETGIGIDKAIKTSLNTVAVRCMQTVGTANALAFLEERFGLILDYEKEKAKRFGEEEVIGNVALGYLNEGVSPADMAGYYQVFATGGQYAAPHTVVKITDKDGDVLYAYQPEGRQVVKDSTAYIMNRLLQNVLTPGGTGERAAIDGVTVGGKTGTGDLGNWFVGFTPSYSCAVWHGTELSSNRACEIFADAVSAFPSGEKTRFPDCGGVKAAAFCCESGLLLSPKCRKVDMGYYSSDAMPEICTIHH